MSTPPTTKPLSISRILLGETRVITQPDGVIVPVIDVRVLAENGAFFGRTFLAFGLDTRLVRSAWENEPEKFLKLPAQGAQSQHHSLES
jgi:hypothetical protein